MKIRASVERAIALCKEFGCEVENNCYHVYLDENGTLHVDLKPDYFRTK